jgi:hypothetical protein
MTNVNIDSGTLDGVTIGTSSAPTVTDLGSVATCDINGGTIDGVTIFGQVTDFTGADANGVSGTAGATQTLSMWNGDGDLVAATGELVLPDELWLKFDADPSADHKGTGLTIDGTFGSNAYTGDIMGLMVLSADGSWDSADADAEATVGQLAIALEATDTGTGALLLWGIAENASWSFTAGDQLYVSATAGDITSTAPSASGQFVQVVGYAITSTIIMFNPSPDYVELA